MNYKKRSTELGYFVMSKDWDVLFESTDLDEAISKAVTYPNSCIAEAKSGYWWVKVNRDSINKRRKNEAVQ